VAIKGEAKKKKKETKKRGGGEKQVALVQPLEVGGAGRALS